jgi:hypothetical protein
VRTDGAEGTDVGSTAGATVVVTAGASAAGATEVVGTDVVCVTDGCEAGDDGAVAGAVALVVGSALLDGACVADDDGVDG